MFVAAFFKFLLTVGAVVVASALLLEAALNVYNPLGFRLKGDRIILPINRIYDIEVGNVPGLDRRIVHSKNSIGFRGPEPLQDSSDALTILTIGGSTTENFYLMDGKTWPDLLADRLDKYFAPLWLNNAGLDGHSTYGHIVLVNDYVEDLRPKVILFLVGLNDMSLEAASRFDMRWDYSTSNLRIGGTRGSIKRFGVFAAGRSEVAAMALNLYRHYWSTDRGILHQIGVSLDLYDPDRRQYIEMSDIDRLSQIRVHRERFVENYEARLIRLIAETEAIGAQPILITQPLLVGEGIDPSSGQNLARIAVEFGGQTISGRHYWNLLELYNEKAREVAQLNGVPLLDLAALMPKDSALYYDVVHNNNAGADKVADILFSGLCPIFSEKFETFVIAPCP